MRASKSWIVIVVAALLLLMVGVVTTRGCTGSGGRDMGRSRAALQATEGDAERTARESPEVVDAGVEAFLAVFDEFSPDTVRRRALEVYASEAYFNDGFAELYGAEAVADYLARSAEGTAGLTVGVRDVVRKGGNVFIWWDMQFTARSRTIDTAGISHLRFDRSGRIVYQFDYWDATGALAEFVPLVGGFLNRVRDRL
jgi:limonene-1,2-epoxide hydrolase